MNSNSDLDYFVSRLNRETNLPELIVINNSFMSRLEVNGDIYVEVLNDDFRVTYKSTSLSFTFTQDAIDFVLNIHKNSGSPAHAFSEEPCGGHRAQYRSSQVPNGSTAMAERCSRAGGEEKRYFSCRVHQRLNQA